MTSVLVAVAFYPDDKGNKLRYYTHVRNKYYAKSGIHVTVLNFATDHNYIIDGIRVISLESFKKNQDYFDVLICHAPNLRNHYRFLKKYQRNFPKIIFFFHGQEIMHLTKYYPDPYSFKQNRSFVKKIFRNGYDALKLRLWRRYFLTLKSKANFVFVSDWLRDVFFRELRLETNQLAGKTRIINNSVGEPFEVNTWSSTAPKKFDFITIRNHFDESTYAIDVLVATANANPEYRFCLIGKGVYFEHNSKPDNLELITAELSHEEILSYLDASRCGLMFTRHDTQGVMSCEMATYGIPLITSKIAICKEIFSSFKNVKLVDNTAVDLNQPFNDLMAGVPYAKNSRYSFRNTVLKEVELINNISKDEQ